MSPRAFEMRIYHAVPGRMEALHARFRDHTCDIFARHGIGIVGFWIPQDPTAASERLVYLLSYPDRQAADQSWPAFRDDPDWQAAKAASEEAGPIDAKVESELLDPTDYSPLGCRVFVCPECIPAAAVVRKEQGNPLGNRSCAGIQFSVGRKVAFRSE